MRITYRKEDTMSTDAMGYILALLAIGMSMVATRNRSTPLTIGTAAIWSAFLSFMVANNTAGLNWLAILIIGIITFIVAYLLLAAMSSRFTGSQKIIGADTTEEFTKAISKEKKNKMGVLGLTPSEYKAYLQSRRQRRR